MWSNHELLREEVVGWWVIVGVPLCFVEIGVSVGVHVLVRKMMVGGVRM